MHTCVLCVVGWLQCCSYLSWDRRLMMLHNVAAGMSYLHGRSHVHADLRSTNLFVGADGMVSAPLARRLPGHTLCMGAPSC